MKVSVLKSGVKRAAIGAWVKDIPISGMEDLALKVRGLRNSDAQRLRGDLVAVLSEADRKKLPEDKQDEIALAVLADAVLLDWNLTDEAGAPLDCTPHAAREMMTDPDIGERFREAVAYAGSVVAKQGVDNLEADEKN